ncbi:hypothetical protein GQ53DRAFT_749600 [Thozetella sp. PMI_491]|nr:hypothetical protein GQ53DRAFT_749600 [Thozetella sp. PMI_491]
MACLFLSPAFPSPVRTLPCYMGDGRRRSCAAALAKSQQGDLLERHQAGQGVRGTGAKEDQKYSVPTVSRSGPSSEPYH